MEKIEPLRARRIRDRNRIFHKALRIVANEYKLQPGTHNSIPYIWTDGKGKKRKGFLTWKDVFDSRKVRAHHRMNNMTPCSCSKCGNPRKWYRESSYQEILSDIDALEQIMEVGKRFRNRFRKHVI